MNRTRIVVSGLVAAAALFDMAHAATFTVDSSASSVTAIVTYSGSPLGEQVARKSDHARAGNPQCRGGRQSRPNLGGLESRLHRTSRTV